ncbi:MAG: hypothetical protein FJ149_04990 [Euryarchaeota archaeon]|nr:hypothetical protein [Euryarchaeota archaeon]
MAKKTLKEIDEQDNKDKHAIMTAFRGFMGIRTVEKPVQVEKVDADARAGFTGMRDWLREKEREPLTTSDGKVLKGIMVKRVIDDDGKTVGYKPIPPEKHPDPPVPGGAVPPMPPNPLEVEKAQEDARKKAAEPAEPKSTRQPVYNASDTNARANAAKHISYSLRKDGRFHRDYIEYEIRDSLKVSKDTAKAVTDKLEKQYAQLSKDSEQSAYEKTYRILEAEVR